MNLKTFLLVVSLALPFSMLHAQESKFRYRADVLKADSDAVYKIFLQPALIAKCVSRDLYDIRLADEKGKFIAYAIVDKQTDGNPVFLPFPEVKQDVKSDSVTTFIVDANSGNQLGELWIRLKSNEVTRTANLSGSDDLQRWYAIKEDIELDGDQSGHNTEYEQQLTFPESKYRYYRVRISNKNNDPLQITAAGVYQATGHTPMLISAHQAVLPAVKQGSKQTSYIIDLGDDHQVDELVLHVSSPKYYTRNVSVYDISRGHEDLLTTDIINSRKPNALSFSSKTNRIRIDVQNGDDNPLVIDGIDVFQLARSAVAYLEKGHQYHLLAGDSTANEVSYDLTFLHSKPMSKFPSLSHSPVYKNPAFITFTVVPHRNFTPLLWGAIIVVLIVLSLLTWRMVKELGTK